MNMHRIRMLCTTAVFSISYLLMGARPLAGQDDCQALIKSEADAFGKLQNTPAHVYSTTKIGDHTVDSEVIYAAGSIYGKVNGKWMVMDTIKSAEQLQQQAMHRASAKDTCRYLRDEPENGEIAALYSTHSETSRGTMDMQIWISKRTGLILRHDIDSNGGKVVMSSRYDYANVKPPL